jgi:uncharacterized membrane protein YqiK
VTLPALSTRTKLIVAGVAVVLVLGGMAWLNWERISAEWTRRFGAATQEAQNAQAQGVPAPAPVVDVGPTKDRLTRENAILRERVKKAEALAKATAALQAQTALTPISAPVAKGDRLRLGLDMVELRGKAGARLIAATMEARDEAGALLLRAPVEAPLTLGVEEMPPPPEVSRWGVGAVGGITGTGSVVGGVLSTPSAKVPFVGWKVEGTAVVAGGPGGVVALGGLVVRP